MALSTTLEKDTVIAGKLRVVRLLGVGGMGAVYEVEHLFTKHRRAMKMLHAEMTTHKQIVARFLREASAAGHIGDAHIVETFDAGTADNGAPYIVMEMLEGETLTDRLEKNPNGLPLAELVDIVRQACRGVHAAHAAGIVHRDLKPENLFLIEKDGKPFVKILDFGISKFDPTLPGGSDTTKEGATLGTPFYMSPEQVNGDKDIDGRTDLYALGVILYECAAGRRPFIADALPKLAVLIHEGNYTPLDEVRTDLPTDFSGVVKKAMARSKEDRFASAQELATALKPFSSAALDPTLPETKSVWPRVVVGTPSSRMDDNLAARASGPTMAGSAISVAGADEVTASTPKKRSPLLPIVGLGVAVVVGVGGYKALQYSGTISAESAGSSTPGQVQSIATIVATPSASTRTIATTLTPPSASVTQVESADRAKKDAGPPANSASSTSSTSVPQKTNPGASIKTNASAATATTAPPSASAAAPPASSRVDQKGLANDNPF